MDRALWIELLGARGWCAQQVGPLATTSSIRLFPPTHRQHRRVIGLSGLTCPRSPALYHVFALDGRPRSRLARSTFTLAFLGYRSRRISRRALDRVTAARAHAGPSATTLAIGKLVPQDLQQTHERYEMEPGLSRSSSACAQRCGRRVIAFPITCRVAWHASARTTRATARAGPTAARCVRAEERSANASLGIVRDLSTRCLKYPDVSQADLWTLAGALSIEFAGGPHVPRVQPQGRPRWLQCPMQATPGRPVATHLRTSFTAWARRPRHRRSRRHCSVSVRRALRIRRQVDADAVAVR